LKILILKPSSLGDVVQAIPVLRLLRKHLPRSEIYWWIDSALAPLLEGDPDVTKLVLFERRRWGAPRYGPELWRHVLWLRRQAYDWVIDLQSLARTGAIGWLANGALTIGLDESREGARGFYDIIVRRPSFHTHAVDWYLEVLRYLRVPVNWDFTWLPPRDDVAEKVREKWPVGMSRWIAIQPGARWANKRWPAEYFAELVRAGAKRSADTRFAILGAAEDQPLGQTIAAADPQRCLDLTGKLSLPEMVEWIRLSKLMVTNDTGPMHVAAALRTPLIALFGPTEPQRTGPYGQLESVLQLNLPCVPCMKPRCSFEKPFECLRGLRATEVWRVIESRLDGDRSRHTQP
jgi:lipopolysaccharide heptosyltransferase II